MGKINMKFLSITTTILSSLFLTSAFALPYQPKATSLRCPISSSIKKVSIPDSVNTFYTSNLFVKSNHITKKYPLFGMDAAVSIDFGLKFSEMKVDTSEVDCVYTYQGTGNALVLTSMLKKIPNINLKNCFFENGSKTCKSTDTRACKLICSSR